MAVACEAAFERGHGLGNRLFPWARARLYASAHGVPMLAPRWVSPRLRPLLRDPSLLPHYSRQVLLAGQFQPRDDDLTGADRRSFERLAQVHPEPHPPSTLNAAPDFDIGNHVIRFEGDAVERFALLEGHDRALRSELRAITRPRWLACATERAEAPIGIHVRLGDFRSGPPEALRTGWGAFSGAWRTPLHWYTEMMTLIRERIGPVPAFVVSDGSPRDLVPLLDLGGIRVMRSGSPLCDLWTLAGSRVLLASIGSSYSGWASFLGQMPCAVYPYPDAHAFPIRARSGAYNGMVDPSEHPSEFLASVEDAVGG